MISWIIHEPLNSPIKESKISFWTKRFGGGGLLHNFFWKIYSPTWKAGGEKRKRKREPEDENGEEVEVKPELDTDIKEEDQFDEEDSTVRYPCLQCDYTATLVANLRKHIEYKHLNIKYSCDQCKHKASTPSNLKGKPSIIDCSCDFQALTLDGDTF